MANARSHSRLPVLVRSIAPKKRTNHDDTKGEMQPIIEGIKKKRWDISIVTNIPTARSKCPDKNKTLKIKPPVFDATVPSAFVFTKSGLQMGVESSTRAQSTTVSKTSRKLKNNSRSAAAFGISALVKSETALFEKTSQQSAIIEALEGEVARRQAEELRMSEMVSHLEKENRDYSRKLHECNEFLKKFHLDPESGKPIAKAIMKKDLNSDLRKNFREVMLQQRRCNERPETSLTFLQAKCEQVQSMMSSTVKIHQEHISAMKNFMAGMEILQQEVNSDTRIL